MKLLGWVLPALASYSFLLSPVMAQDDQEVFQYEVSERAYA
jgi:hypothetical protein